jgi:hypothetical protein
MSDQPIAKACTYTGQHNAETQKTNIHASSKIQTHDPSNQAAKTYVYDCMATGTSCINIIMVTIMEMPQPELGKINFKLGF